MRLNFICRFSSKNIGDTNCSPFQYYDFFDRDVSKIEVKNIKDVHYSHDETYIVGGGLFIRNHFKHIRSYKNLVAWGVGIRKLIEREDKLVFDGIDNSLIGIRDVVEGCPYEWVPCPSCKHHMFDYPHEEKHEFVVYEHHSKPLRDYARQLNMPVMSNKGDTINNALLHIGSGANVITNSYHGMYWATLLGKNVYVTNELNSKIRTLKYQPTYIDGLSDALSIPSRSYSEALQECREINDKFYNRVMELS